MSLSTITPFVSLAAKFEFMGETDCGFVYIDFNPYKQGKMSQNRSFIYSFILV